MTMKKNNFMVRKDSAQTSTTTLIASFLVGLIVGGICFWAGHQFWPQNSANKATNIISSLPRKNQPDIERLPFGETTIADIASKAVESVVNIDTSSSITIANSPFSNHPLNEFDFFFGPSMNPFQGPSLPRKFEQRGAGSGIIIRSDGYILTNNHVVQKADNIKVTLNNNSSFQGKVIGRDAFTDLALVKIEANNLPVARLGSSKGLRPGDWAIAIGSPLGLSHTVTLGIISAIGRSLGGVASSIELIQTDAAINPGNSGGPLLNIHGEVIGLNVAIRGDGQNIGFAIPIDIAKTTSEELLAHGSIARPYLGIYMQDINDELAQSLGLAANTKGVIIAHVGPNSPADKAGINQGDVIQKIDGKSVTESKEVQKIIRSHKPGEKLNMLILRDNTLSAIPVTLGNHPGQSVK
jgi:Do/DeqQ family serine protease